MKNALTSLLLLAAASASGAAEPPCAADAIKQARKLLAWHNGPDGDGPVSVDPQVKPLAPLANPANKTQKFSVLEVAGHIQKANYRMRLIYATMPGLGGTQCLLMGQEILELSSL